MRKNIVFWMFCILFFGNERIFAQSNNPLIIGGNKDLSHPAVGTLVQRYSSNGSFTSFCTATLVTQQIVLTASHCVEGMEASSSLVNYRFRADFSDSTEPSGFRSAYHEIQKAIHHPMYSRTSLDFPNYDIAILILKKAVTDITPISINTTSLPKTLIGETAFFMGYGQIQTQPQILSADQKYSAEIEVTQLDNYKITHMDKTTPKSICHGDSGGPALYKFNGEYRVIAVNSIAYQASAHPNGNQTLCDGGGQSTRTDAHLDFLVPYLTAYQGKGNACKADTDCLSCNTCQQSVCTFQEPANVKSHCAPCTKDSECGVDGLCRKFEEGYRCLQACTSDYCCPSGNICQKETISAGSKNVCKPLSGVCPSFQCTKDAECGAFGKCNVGKCDVQRPANSAMLCKSCYSSSQCGSGNVCLEGTSGIGFCSQACGAGDFCPVGFECKNVSLSVKQCIPKTETSCLSACTKTSDCVSGQTCAQGYCQKAGGASHGEHCSDAVVCAKEHLCLPGTYGSRCFQKCGASSGVVGSQCNNGVGCTDNSTCFRYSGFSVCLDACATDFDCKGGGSCQRFGRGNNFCFCQDDSDCKSGYTCNSSASGGSYGGCVAKKNISSVLCPGGNQCSSSSSAGQEICLPKEGNVETWGECSESQRCQKGNLCTIISQSNNASVCLEDCTSNNQCKKGGICVALGGSNNACLCRQNSDCGLFGSCKDLGRGYGVCSFPPATPNPTGECKSNTDCPNEFSCQVNLQGKYFCSFDATKKNEPFEELPVEKVPELDAGLPEREPSFEKEKPQEEKIVLDVLPETIFVDILPKEKVQETQIKPRESDFLEGKWVENSKLPMLKDLDPKYDKIGFCACSSTDFPEQGLPLFLLTFFFLCSLRKKK